VQFSEHFETQQELPGNPLRVLHQWLSAVATNSTKTTTHPKCTCISKSKPAVWRWSWTSYCWRKEV
jgi:hypothetical protein